MLLEPSIAGGPIARMFADMPVKTRTKTAHTVAQDYATTSMSRDDLALAEAIINYLLLDIDPAVRAALSEELKDCNFLNREAVKKLAQDIDVVSLPIIALSPLLTERDLLEIFETASEAKQIAIADRAELDLVVTDQIAERACFEAVEACLENQGAIIGRKGYQHILARFGNEESIQELLVRRPSLPKDTVKRLCEFISEDNKQELMEGDHLSDALSARMILNARERVLAKSLSRRMTDYEQKKASISLQKEGRLTATLMLRSLISGNQSFFLSALAEASGISKKRVNSLTSGRGYLGFKRLYERAEMPNYLYEAFRTVLEEQRNARHYHPRADMDNLQQRLIDRIAHVYEWEDDLSLEELMEKLLPKRIY
ncbi:DUF2336 domain-containing protein [Sneathiella marina]|uniref:DUF2336 domain-containing protein n=1 Tax=Sneathiella marina TaxID=2950108 RepID=A0ABY4W0V8_9PROT|nr:DUF2336 domain-containing protein [Sneathiella marina]USG60765.1 DUF2336 domain-containing protein [Sneathiella marina]